MFGYAEAVVDPMGRKPELVGTVVVTEVETVVEKESVSVDVLETTAVIVLVEVTVEVVENISVTALAVTVAMTCVSYRVRMHFQE